MQLAHPKLTLLRLRPPSQYLPRRPRCRQWQREQTETVPKHIVDQLENRPRDDPALENEDIDSMQRAKPTHFDSVEYLKAFEENVAEQVANMRSIMEERDTTFETRHNIIIIIKKS